MSPSGFYLGSIDYCNSVQERDPFDLDISWATRPDYLRGCMSVRKAFMESERGRSEPHWRIANAVGTF